MASKPNQPFTDKEKAKLAGCLKCNELLKRLMPITHSTLTTEDYRLVNVIGSNKLIIHNRNYSGKGVKMVDPLLSPLGVRMFQEWQREQKEVTSADSSQG